MQEWRCCGARCRGMLQQPSGPRLNWPAAWVTASSKGLRSTTSGLARPTLHSSVPCGNRGSRLSRRPAAVSVRQWQLGTWGRFISGSAYTGAPQNIRSKRWPWVARWGPSRERPTALSIWLRACWHSGISKRLARSWNRLRDPLTRSRSRVCPRACWACALTWRWPRVSQRQQRDSMRRVPPSSARSEHLTGYPPWPGWAQPALPRATYRERSLPPPMRLPNSRPTARQPASSPQRTSGGGATRHSRPQGCRAPTRGRR